MSDSNSGKNSSGSKPTNTKHNSILYFQPSAEVKSFARRYRTEISAGASSILSTFVAFPLDFAKSRMQSYKTTFRATIFDAYRTEGIKTFWRGVGPPMLSITIVRTVSFSMYQRAKYAIDRGMTQMTGKSPLAMANALNSYPNIYTLSCFGAAGAFSGFVITSISCPFELTKLNEQLAGKVARDAHIARETAIRHGSRNARPVSIDKTGALFTARRLFAQRGIPGLYSGYQLHLLRDTIGTAIYFMTYESAKQALANARGKEPTTPTAVVIAGGLCGIVSWACIYPIDVAKTVYQKALLASPDGRAVRPPIKFFQFGSYRGLGVSVLRSCLLNMIFFSNFEWMKKRINALEV